MDKELQQATKIAEATLRQCFRLISTKKHALPDPVYMPELVISTRCNGLSWGSKDKIQIAIKQAIPKSTEWITLYLNNEYVSFCDDPVIGSFTTTNWHNIIKSDVCHEAAHSFLFQQQHYTKPHGKEWKSVYALFRQRFVNKHVTPHIRNQI